MTLALLEQFRILLWINLNKFGIDFFFNNSLIFSLSVVFSLILHFFFNRAKNTYFYRVSTFWQYLLKLSFHLVVPVLKLKTKFLIVSGNLSLWRNVHYNKFQFVFLRNFSSTKVLSAKNKTPITGGKAGFFYIGQNIILLNKWGHRYLVNFKDLIFEPCQDGKHYWCEDSCSKKKYIVEIDRVKPLDYVFPENATSVILTRPEDGVRFSVETKYAVLYPYSARTHLWLYVDARTHYSSNNKNRYIVCKSKATRLVD